MENVFQPQKANLNYTPKFLQAENQKETGTPQKVRLAKCLLTINMIAYALIVIIQGCTKESINLWAPSVLNDIANGKNAVQISLFTSLIPVFSTVGLLLTGWLIRCFCERQEQTMLVLLCGGAVSGWLMVWLKNSFAGVAVCMSIVLAVVYGVNTILTTLLPLCPHGAKRDIEQCV